MDDEETDDLIDTAEESEIQEEEDGAGRDVDTQSEAVDDENAMPVIGDLDKYLQVYEQTFEKIQIPTDVQQESLQALQDFLATQTSREAAGDVIFSAIFEAAPSLQGLFKGPRSIMSQKFVAALLSLATVGPKPGMLKTQVETIGFQHLDVDVTVARADVFRDAILELFDQELGPKFTTKARFGLQILLNYASGALIFIRREYASRIRIIQNSWQLANKKAAGITDVQEALTGTKKGQEKRSSISREQTEEDSEGELDLDLDMTKNTDGMMVPNSFNDMFLFNAAVMGLSNNEWMNLILDQLDAIANNVANPYRLQEECEVLALVLSRYHGSFVLSEFKAVVLASLRSLVPTEWTSEHEVAWNWLWQNVERLLKSVLGKPQVYEKALTGVLSGLPDDQVAFLRQEFFLNFFKVAPTGQDFFKQSLTRLYYIADKIIEMTTDIYTQPRAMVEDISGLGLRHVGYAIPAELFPPFVTSAVEIFSQVTTDDTAITAFQWSMSLVCKILVRATSEGSTVVMKAISTNDEVSMKKAMATSARGKRAQELLNISVGTQSISPFYWSIQSGNLNSAKAILEDLLTIRADRDVYYYACDDLFTRHPDVVKYLMTDVPLLLDTLFNGLVWRSRWINKGYRRVNYYVKHLVQDLEGQPSETLSWLADYRDPKLISHETIVTMSDILWDGVKYQFLRRRLFFILSLCLFLASQSVLTVLEPSQNIRNALFVCRTLIYVLGLPQLLYVQLKSLCEDCRNGDVDRILRVPVPQYLWQWQGLGSLILLWLLIMMCTLEPMYWCLGDLSYPLFSVNCPAGLEWKRVYSTFSCVAMMIYWSLCLLLSVFHMRLSAFILVCKRVMSEVGLFLLALAFILLASTTSVVALDHTVEDFGDMGAGTMTLLEMALSLYPTSKLDELRHEEVLLVFVIGFCIFVTLFLFSMLIAQLNQAYQHGFEDMLGYARLNRVQITVAELEVMPQKRWLTFLESLALGQHLEFNEGDVGVSGGVQVLELGSLHPTATESIRRYGGSTAPSMPWPEEPGDYGSEDKFEKLEKLIIRTTKSLAKGNRKHGGGASGVSGVGSSMAQSASSGGDSSNESV
ncbi:unnamed protein product [Effrenium voratum]|uniref:Uncharacterized protein n=1 Tax=Effrenium voratum TaxID=2562239 RepID=A0AA36J771_9DINO|nr:unnamed protein product [Effrenium voratum]CAJ1400908.1 unnamed protein product [Effrenium voratum]CAJ1432106.1 unnamed protein product [Effrenium voratum]